MTSLKITKLGDIASFRNGLNFNQSSTGEAVQIIGVSNFGNRFEPNYSELDSIIVEGKLSEDDFLKKGDLVFVRSNGNKTLVGRSLYITQDSNISFSGFCIRARIQSEVVDSKYFAYFTKSKQFKRNIAKGAIGTNINNLNQGILKEVSIPTPPLAKQKTIAKVLSDLDSKIELNNKINAELEAMAKLLYDYWFVQFDFPFDFAQGKPSTNGKPYKSSGGKMVYNEQLKREIPEGWEVQLITEEYDTQYGFPFSTKLFNKESQGIPVTRIRDILSNSIGIYSTEVVDEKYRLNLGDLVLGMDGNFHLNFWSKEGAFLNQRCFRIRKKENTKTSLFQALYTSEPFIKARENNVSRTTVGHLSARDINSLYVLVPCQQELVEKCEIFDNMLSKMMLSRNQNQKLSELRDWLLPMLMNGQVTVRQAHGKPFGDVEQEMNMAAEPSVRYGRK